MYGDFIGTSTGILGVQTIARGGEALCFLKPYTSALNQAKSTKPYQLSCNFQRLRNPVGSTKTRIL